MISLDLMKSSEVRKAGDQSKCIFGPYVWILFIHIYICRYLYPNIMEVYAEQIACRMI